MGLEIEFQEMVNHPINHKPYKEIPVKTLNTEAQVSFPVGDTH